jgi:prephenate dehydrogenase
MPERILIVGTGLVGGSVGLALRTVSDAYVIGVDADAANAERAKEAGAVDEVVPSAPDGAAEADVVLVATPVGEILAAVRGVAASARPGTVVTDVGSTKGTIVTEAETLLGRSRPFVGGHPMAGTEGEGIAAARADLFDGALWILTPTQHTDPDAFGRVNAMVTGLRARTLALDPDAHDRLVARVSHLPYAIATSLMAMTAADGDPRVFEAAAGSFRDVTRTAGTNPRIWHDIFSTNRGAVVGELARMVEELTALRRALEEGDLGAVDALIATAREGRKHLPIKGERTPAEPVTLEVYIPDRAGVIAQAATALGDGGVNIEDLSMDHSGAGGTLRITVDGRANAEKALDLLAARDFRGTVVEDP